MYFEVEIDGDTLEPRFEVKSVAYAMWAANALSEDEIRTALDANLLPGSCGTDETMRWDGTAWVCSTVPAGEKGDPGDVGVAGPAGEPGIAGLDGDSVTATVEPSGANCTDGGVALMDAAGTTYLCNGLGGTDGTSVAVAVEPAGVNCADGGVEVTDAAGLSYVCNGAVGNAGADGATGAQGPAGADGATGAQGTPGADGADGATGAQGAPGADGADGATGAQGAPGADGADGATGAQGTSGADGADGATGAQGAPGADGATGAQGAPGADGATGAQGAPGADGADGATGAAGATGAQGPQGPQGPAGGGGASLPAPPGGLPTTIVLSPVGADSPFAVTVTHRVHFAQTNQQPFDADVCRIDVSGTTPEDGMTVTFITSHDPSPSSPTGGDGWRFQAWFDTADCGSIPNSNIFDAELPLLNDINEGTICTFRENIIRNGTGLRDGWVCQ